MGTDRRDLLKGMAGAALGAAAFPASLQKALALAPRRRTGTINDIEHVVILMQENRAFDHYYGMLGGVRGYGDPRPHRLPTGKPVWYQQSKSNMTVSPFALDGLTTSAQFMHSLDHSWKRSQERWKNYDIWIDTKGPMTMGHFIRADIPFYYTLADAFTVCDAYHCSIFGPTTPNRLFLFTGTSGLGAGYDGLHVIRNTTEDINQSADPANDADEWPGYEWTTYPERLQKAGIDWFLYQEYDNYSDNPLAYFVPFRGPLADRELQRRGRGCVPGSTSENELISRGDYIVKAFARDVTRDRLAQVSWIVAPYIVCEHPAAPPGYGESFVARLLEALAANPEVWAKTAFILNYDENDGFFDHIPPPVPALTPDQGISTVPVKGESYQGIPVGLGPRVPAMVISPWTRGGWVNSQLFDHTSVIRFLEARFGIHEPNITPWRRSVCGDLTTVFDFSATDNRPAKGPGFDLLSATANTKTLPPPSLPAMPPPLPVQETGSRPARALPYSFTAYGDFDAASRRHRFAFANHGNAGIHLCLYAAEGNAGPWSYTVGAGDDLATDVPVMGGAYDFMLHGPNGFVRQYRGSAGASGLSVAEHYDPAGEAMVVTLHNASDVPMIVSTRSLAYDDLAGTYKLAPGETQEERRPIAAHAHWYDFIVTTDLDLAWLIRMAGHVETGKPSLSDPAIGQMIPTPT